VDSTGGAPADVVVDIALVERLVADQHPDLVGEVSVAAEGWDNVVFRLGRHLAVRMPRRRLGASLVEGELRWLPELAPRLPLEIPVPVRAGEPGAGYPYPWSVVRWVEGATLLDDAPADRGPAGAALGAFCSALHTDAPTGAPRNPWRGVALEARSERVVAGLARLPRDLDGVAVARAWDRALEATAWPGPPQWVHGDLHPGNVVVRHGVVAGVLDFGDLTAGDPATDLSLGWMLPRPAREAFRGAYGAVDDATEERARGNALAHAVAVLGSQPSSALGTIARRALAAIVGD
jgi:aminoglycoside phosphotransferase (APT) family kinase protein